ncbi:MAG: TRM11 family SAM-dependent methyltransferase [Candidatus Kerfeldbacteria bacterium]
MIKYFFILGTNPLISIAEIFSFAKTNKTTLNIIDVTSHILIIESKEIDINKWQAYLGGTIKIGLIINKYQNINDLLKSVNTETLLNNFFKQTTQKIIFGFSLYSTSLTHYQNKIKSLGIKIKQDLQKLDYKSRFIMAKSQALTAVQINKNKILQQGADIVIAESANGLYIGVTKTIQDFEDYSDRDFGRPQRDAKSGMIPPKLAKIMINLGGVSSDDLLLDPFCGSGTIIQEALLMNINNVIGSDISQKAINDTKNNIDWLTQKYSLTNINISLYTEDVQTLDNDIDSSTVDKIVTEPYLGPQDHSENNQDKINSTINELEKLYLAAFQTFKKITKPSSTIVIVFPLIIIDQDIHVLKILEKINNLGFIRIDPIPENISLFAKIGVTARGSMIYQRPGQRVQREIFIFKKTKN